MIDFFNNSCNENSLTDEEFGICDNQDGTKAYSENTNSGNWIAIVKNNTQKEMTFTPIDNCIQIFQSGTRNLESSCDGMLTFENSLYLIELKEQGTGGWLPTAISQLQNTIRLITENNDISNIRYKKAYACNKKRPHFQVMDSERKKRFYDMTGFRIDAQIEIVIK